LDSVTAGESEGSVARGIPFFLNLPQACNYIQKSQVQKEPLMFWTSIRCGLIALLSLFVLFSNNQAFGQAGTTSIRGTVTDRSGGAIVGAHVTLTSVEQGSVRHASTNGTGAYEFLAISPGSYNVTVEAPGFRKFEHTKLDLLVNVPATENVIMQVGSTSETVEVSAQAATLNTTDASMGVAFGENRTC
jgi:hypothetical protein